MRKRGTLYLEAKSHRLEENGFYVDIFPYDAVSPDAEKRQETAGRLLKIYRTKLMKSHYQPWRENEKILWKKRIGYLYYQARALFADQESLAKAYDALATALPENGYVCEQSAMTKPDAYEKAWCQALTDVTFEGETFKAPAEYDKFLTTLYGDYMQLPPENQRENRHQIVQIDFGD